MQELERLETGFADAGDLAFVEHRLCDNVSQGAALKVLHHYPQLLLFWDIIKAWIVWVRNTPISRKAICIQCSYI